MVKIFKLKNIISIKDFEREDIEYILDEASKLEDRNVSMGNALDLQAATQVLFQKVKALQIPPKCLKPTAMRL